MCCDDVRQNLLLSTNQEEATFSPSNISDAMANLGGFTDSVFFLLNWPFARFRRHLEQPESRLCKLEETGSGVEVTMETAVLLLIQDYVNVN